MVPADSIEKTETRRLAWDAGTMARLGCNWQAIRRKIKAGDRSRTDDIQLGRLTFYH